MRILVVEDERRMAKAIAKGLREASYAADISHDGEDALHLATAEPYDLIIMDIMIPKLDGVSVLREMRSRQVQTPVIFLTAKSSVDDRVEGLNAGGDDYLTKPFSFAELLARVRALLRRPGQSQSVTLNVGTLSLDPITREVTRAGKDIGLTNKEFALLHYFMQNTGEVLTRTMIGEHVWDRNFYPMTNVIDVYVNSLRNKVDRKFDEPLIHTVRGIGYVLRAEPNGASAGENR